MKKVILFANVDWYLYNFRLGLAKELRDRGTDVVLVSPKGEYAASLQAEGFRFIELPFESGSKNPLKNWRLKKRIHSLYHSENPDLVHHFTIKCVLFGGLAARRSKIPMVNAVTGLGHLFTHNSMVNRLLRPLVCSTYRKICRAEKSATIFQNKEDQQYFVDRGLVDSKNATLIRGSGADCDRFVPLENPNGRCKIVFASRLIREKGVFELIEAIRILKAKGLDFDFVMAGDPFPGNPSSLTETEISAYQQEFDLPGHVDDMPALLRSADIVVLPSWAEGTPRVLLEAGACGKPIVATNIAGCRGVVVPGRNGMLVPVGDVMKLADALEKLFVNPDLRRQYGKESRKLIESGFSEKSVIERTIQVYDRLLA